MTGDRTPVAGGDLLVTVSQGVMQLTFNRPRQRNAMTRAVAEAVAEALEELDSDPGLAVGVLTGAEGCFCAGMDLKRFLAGERALVPGKGFGGLVDAPPAKPLIAAVEGWALAGGFEMALACDVVVAAKGARFGLPEVRRGLAAAAGGLVRLPQRLPRNIAMELALTGEHVPAQRLHAYGLVNHVTEDGAALDKALEVAASIAANAPLSVIASKRVIVESGDWSAADVVRNESALLGPVLDSADAQEGALAFVEKRPPRWSGT